MGEQPPTPKDINPHRESVTPEASKTLELPIRASNVGGRYFLYFTSQQAAERFVIAFWKQIDSVRQTPEESGESRNFTSGMWEPTHEVTSGCRSGIMAPVNAEQKEGGAVSIVYINGNTGSLQPDGVEALQKLGIS